ncbi:E3 ubiquitin-protein ligase BRE1-like isoform X2 [Drosophila obscura]|uniref:E3 ubiquitin-protein ligase BRE1-like isoform X2 n=1 Tax=Drosophila obscura TaxID=7282 RepID=UPI001BB15F45|nr:E3 ubiquitin-protein ligase BRE1-like isoform X2 [Drosophila obscura]
MEDTNDKAQQKENELGKIPSQELKTDDLASHQDQRDKKLKIDMQQEKIIVDEPKMVDKSTQLTVQKLQQQIEVLENNRKLLLNRLAEVAEVKSHNVKIQKKDNEVQPQNSQVDQTATEVNQILKQLEQQISKTATLEDNLEELDKSTKLIIEELGQQIAELEEDHRLFRSELDEKEHAYLEEIDDLQEEVDDLYINITCSICQSPWTSDGEHRLVSLYCGHLFGKECVQRLAECPTCGSEIRSTGVRPIFGRNILPAN